MTGPELKTQVSFVASIKKINAELSRDTMRWCRVKADRRAGDFKHAKLVYYQAIIIKKELIGMPEFFLTGPSVDIMDGRHRLYALFDAGYTALTICCKKMDLAGLEAKIGR